MDESRDNQHSGRPSLEQPRRDDSTPFRVYFVNYAKNKKDTTDNEQRDSFFRGPGGFGGVESNEEEDYA